MGQGNEIFSFFSFQLPFPMLFFTDDSETTVLVMVFIVDPPSSSQGRGERTNGGERQLQMRREGDRLVRTDPPSAIGFLSAPEASLRGGGGGGRRRLRERHLAMNARPCIRGHAIMVLILAIDANSPAKGLWVDDFSWFLAGPFSFAIISRPLFGQP